MTKIKIGNIYWLPQEGISHPHVIIKILDHDMLKVCALTTNQKKLSMPGNVILDPGEGNLPTPSIVEVAKVLTVSKTELGEYIGQLTEQRVAEIQQGISFLEKSFLKGRGN